MSYDYYKYCEEHGSVEMVRPTWNHENYHEDIWKEKSVTVLICQYATKELTQLCLESLLQFYPDIPVLVVNGSPHDIQSTNYLRYTSIIHPNVKIWERKGRNSHGMTMDEAIRQFIKTDYVLTMDSDTIVKRGGWIEEILKLSWENGIYSIGSMMYVSRSNYACGAPKDEMDILKYTHPSCSLYYVPIYLKLSPFTDHGAPCVYNLIDAEKKGLKVEYFPVDKYVAHLSGASWCNPATIWPNDHDVKLRPFISFIATHQNHLIELDNQTDHDFDIITWGNVLKADVVIHGSEPKKVDNCLYDLRFKVQGEYVCLLSDEVKNIDPEFVGLVKNEIIKAKAPEEIVIGGLKIVSRKYFQRYTCFE